MLLPILGAERGQRKSLMRCILESAMLPLAAGGSRPKLYIKVSKVLALQA